MPNYKRIYKPTHKAGGSPGLRWSGWRLTQWRTAVLKGEPLCRHCLTSGRVTMAQEIDHIIPLSRGGTYDISNACPLCIDCHEIKTAIEFNHRKPRRIGLDGFPLDT